MGRAGRRAGWTAGALCLSAVVCVAGCNVALSAPDGGISDGGEAGIDAAGLRAQLASAVSTWAAAKSGCSTYSYDRRGMSFLGNGCAPLSAAAGAN